MRTVLAPEVGGRFSKRPYRNVRYGRRGRFANRPYEHHAKPGACAAEVETARRRASMMKLATRWIGPTTFMILCLSMKVSMRVWSRMNVGFTVGKDEVVQKDKSP